MNEGYLIINIHGKQPYDNATISVFPYSNNAKLFDDRNASSFGESEYQLIEGAEYEYEFSDKNLKFAANPEILRPSKSKTTSRGLLKTGIYVGNLELEVLTTDNESVGKVSFEIQSVKTDYRSDYRKMLEDITEYYTDLLMQQSSPVTQKFEVDEKTDNKTLYQKFSFVKSIIDSDTFSEAIHKIQSNPVKKWTETIVNKNICNVKRLGNQAVRQIATSNDRIDISGYHLNLPINSVPRVIKVPYKKETIDIPENRFIKYVLTSFYQFCNRIITFKNASDRLKTEASVICDKISNFLSLQFFKNISVPTFLSLNSPILQKKEGYREIYQAWLMFDLAAKLSWKGGDNVYNAGKRNVAALYEYWLFFKLLETISSVFNINPQSKFDLVKTDDDGINLDLKQGRMKMIEGTFDAGTRNLNVRFYYNRTFGHTDNINSSGSWSTSMRPDYTLSIWPGEIGETEAEREETIVHIHFDAKYRVNKFILQDDYFASEDSLNEEKSEQEKGIYKRADLLKMHAYKDAIRRTSGAYILYPGTEDKTIRGFHEIIPGLGAFCINPKTYSDDSRELKKFLNEVVRHLLNRTSQREKLAFYQYEIHADKPQKSLVEDLPESYGENRDFLPDETTVILGFFKGQNHLQWINNNNLYNVRTGTRRGSININNNLVSAKYLLLHDGNKSNGFYKLDSRGAHLFTKQDLINIGYPSSTPDQEANYLVFNLDINGTEPEYSQYTWSDIKSVFNELTNQRGHDIHIPVPVKLSDLLRLKDK